MSLGASKVTMMGVAGASGWAEATGGTETTYTGYKVHTFLSSGTLTVTKGGKIEALMVAGAGSGGAHHAGGGGAGGTMVLTEAILDAQEYAISIGAGGAAVSGQNRNPGSNTTAFSETCNGGGGGGNYTSNGPGQDG